MSAVEGKRGKRKTGRIGDSSKEDSRRGRETRAERQEGNGTFSGLTEAPTEAILCLRTEDRPKQGSALTLLHTR